MRGEAQFPSRGWRIHFSNTFPLCRRGEAAGYFSWLDADPRQGVHTDSERIPYAADPLCFARNWEQMEKAFGVERKKKSVGDGGGGVNDGNGIDGDGFHFYICPSIRWCRERFIQPLDRPEPQEISWREGLLEHLQNERMDWETQLQFTSGICVQDKVKADAVVQRGLGLVGPTTDAAIGMWLFPADAFKESVTNPPVIINLSAVHPSLILFNV